MIAILGISHKTAPVEIREQFYISKDDIPALGEIILQQTEIAELVILSTCNRTELYFYLNKNCYNKTIKELGTILHSFKNIHDDFSGYFYKYKKQQAATHLFSVASGLESMVLGEDQIVNQIKEAYMLCTQKTFTDAVLMRLFQKAFETSKDVRSQTNIQQGATSISYVAADIYTKSVNDLSDKKVFLIGTGETGKIALSHLRKKGVRKFKLTNRTFQVAHELAQKFNGEVVPFEEYKSHIFESDVVITATNAANHLITFNDIKQMPFGETNGHTRFFIDLSVPRNIDQKISEIDNIKLIGVDDLNLVVEDTSQLRKKSLEDAVEIIDKMVVEYYEWLENRALRPLIKSVTTNLMAMLEKELEISKKCYSHLEMKGIDEFGNRVTQKYIKTIIKNLKKSPQFRQDIDTLQKINELFQLNDD